MRCGLVFVCLLASLRQGSAGFSSSVQIQLQGGKYVLDPNDGMVPPQRLRINDWSKAHFTVRGAETITYDRNGWCVEASGNAVVVNHCTGKPAQRWKWVPNGRGGEIIQLKDTNQCIGVTDTEGLLRGAPVGLRACDDEVAELWKFQDAIATQGQFSMQAVILYIIGMAVVFGLGLSSWLWRCKTITRTMAPSPDGALLNTEQGTANSNAPSNISLQNLARGSTPTMSSSEDSAAASQAAAENIATARCSPKPDLKIPRVQDGDRLATLQRRCSKSLQDGAPTSEMLTVDGDEALISSTLRWLDKFVIRHQICPFASPARKHVRTVVFNGSVRRTAAFLEDELRLLHGIDARQPATTLIVLPRFKHINRFMAFSALMMEANDDADYGIHLVPFHPLASFSGDPGEGCYTCEDAADLSIRSPHPMLHLLRKNDVVAADRHWVEQHAPSPAPDIKERNIRYLRHLGCRDALKLVAATGSNFEA